MSRFTKEKWSFLTLGNKRRIGNKKDNRAHAFIMEGQWISKFFRHFNGLTQAATLKFSWYDGV